MTGGRWLRAGLALSLISVLAYLAVSVGSGQSLTWDAPVALAVHTLSRPWLDVLMALLTETGELGAVALAIGVAVWFLARRQPLNALTAAGGLGGALALNALLKLIFARPRPDLFPPLVAETGFSFPSGHVTGSMAAFGILAVFLWRSRRRGWALLAGGWVLVVAFTRVYLGVHYPSDVLASLCLGALWVWAVFLARDGWARSQALGPPA